MAGEGWQSLIDLAELAVNTRLASNQERTPYELAMAREPRLSLDVNLEGSWVEQGIEPTERLDSWARIRNLAARHQTSHVPSHHEPPTTTRIVFRPRAPRDKPGELPRPHNDYRRELPPLLGGPTRGLVYDPDGRKPRFYIALTGSVVLVLFVVQLWILRRIAALHVTPS
ncbi:hypothetical protein EXIGLDRAFT_837603 [Exidia glandulosa HHB12029]|uniref:Uncharacterized protein n=1 Tax=Exidia glandulosa HHB12029 TaxID=1314781 RepID=A0A165GNF5_EXIGL|nr:hypothetical protein EXIGLDRAFT_837603 [Exidia glandulosa HHB12029]